LKFLGPVIVTEKQKKICCSKIK